MSDNEDLLGDDLGDQSLADYNLGNEEEEQLLADDYESGSSQNVPTSMGPNFGNSVEIVPSEFPGHGMEYNPQLPYQPLPEPECVVPNITVEVPNSPLVPLPDHNMFPFEQSPVFGPEHAVVPPPIPATVPIESSQIVPSEMPPPGMTGGLGGVRYPERARQPQVRDIPDTLDKVIVRGQRGRGNWRQRFQSHPYHRNNTHRANFNQRASFPPPQIRASPPPVRPELNRPELPDIRPEPVPVAPPPIPVRPELSPERPMLQEVPFRPENPPFRPEAPIFRPVNPVFRSENTPFRPDNPQFRPDNPQFRPENPSFRPEHPPYGQFRFQFRPEDRNFRPNFNPIDRFPYPRQFAPRPFGPPIREIVPNNISHMPQVTIRQPLPLGHKGGREPEVRMLPLQLPPNLPPGGLAGKKVLINPHFKGTFQPPVEGLPLPAYIPTRIHKSPPLSPTLENKFGPIKDIDDAAERFIAEQRDALARAATRKFRRSPQRYIENTTIEIENELAAAPVPARRNSDDELLRRQEEFINANRAGLRRRMRSPSPPDTPRDTREPAREPREAPREPRDPREPPREPREMRERRRSLSPRRSPDRRRASPPRDEESEYRRRMREQESLRERVLRAKEFRRRKNAVAATQAVRNDRDRERPNQDKEKDPLKVAKVEEKPTMDVKPDSTEKEKVRERSPVRIAEVNSTSETLTPPRENLPRVSDTPEPAMTPPLPDKSAEKSTDKSDKLADRSADKLLDSDDDLDMILGDIDGILSDDEDTGRFKEKAKKQSPPPAAGKASDLRSKLPPRSNADRPPKQRIIFRDDKKKATSPPRRAAASSSVVEDSENLYSNKGKQKADVATNKSRPRIIFDKKEAQQLEKKEKEEDRKPQTFANRRVILQTKLTQIKEKSVFSRIDSKTDPSKPNPGIFSRAVRTAIGAEKTRIVVKKDEPTVEYGTDSDDEGMALVSNLPEGMTDTRLKTLAGSDVQTLILDKEACTAKISFRTPAAAELFKRKFDNKMISKSRLSVKLT